MNWSRKYSNLNALAGRRLSPVEIIVIQSILSLLWLVMILFVFNKREKGTTRRLRLVLYAAKHIIHPMICRILFAFVSVGDALVFEYVISISPASSPHWRRSRASGASSPPDFPYWFLIMIPQNLLMLFSIIFVDKTGSLDRFVFQAKRDR